MRTKLTALAAAAVMLITAVGCGSKQTDDKIVVPIYKTKDINYKTEEAVIGDITQKYYVEGRFDYPYSEKVKFKKAGIIKSINVEENDTVKAGDILCTLDSEELDQQLEEKKVYLEQAKKTVSKLAQDGGSKKEIEMANVQLEVLQLEYDHMTASYDDYNVYAPCDGVFRTDGKTAFGHGIAEQRGADSIIIVGGSVKASQTLGKISDHSKQYLICEVYDNPLENVNFGTRVNLEQGASQAQGKVVDILKSEGGGMVIYTYVIDLDKDADLSDLPVQCVFDVYSKLDTVLVPTEAIKTSKDRTYVNLLIDGTKIEQDVETGLADGKQTEIVSGLAGGEQVIVN
ncbi:Multidrug efflux pump subunit AcrA (membrane-fusion protein) [Ruminococcus sp. YE71]|uniref:efflux RND transporter periplasmic adaptor subunit n=1 Tax=unclassified Ruminococcus TaxID=2608920 RepID=UPI00088DC518|nr:MULTISPECIES: HlyD family efflux transporter periplasmic adaptor subunit [unclassified Ruminococcus]SDA15909.1 Multidrug efflux pump subunit AcrA (membrane-fusion protein) [Ruminococcus sp. YE78]SFW23448.1 Multidrug efflux pump subunit AcrA (membrane-fusion protein) [Ruminococcus sp. YE71]